MHAVRCAERRSLRKVPKPTSAEKEQNERPSCRVRESWNAGRLGHAVDAPLDPVHDPFVVIALAQERVVDWIHVVDVVVGCDTVRVADEARVLSGLVTYRVANRVFGRTVFRTSAQLDRVGCFTYSAVDGAAANALPNPIPEVVKQERYHRFMQKQQEISANKLQQRIGQQMTVLVEHRDADGYVARSYADAPEIDGVVHITTPNELATGEFCRVSIDDADEYDLYATPSK